MSRGRPALSPEVHALKGTRPTRAKPEEESSVVAARPRTPKHLSPDALAAWKEAVRLLRKKGTLAASDAATLELYAEVKATWIQAKKAVAEKGLTIEEQRFSKSGDPYTVTIVNPALKIAQDATRQLLAFTKALGLAPTEREKVKQAKPKHAAEKPAKGSIGELLMLMPKQYEEENENV